MQIELVSIHVHEHGFQQILRRVISCICSEEANWDLISCMMLLCRRKCLKISNFLDNTLNVRLRHFLEHF